MLRPQKLAKGPLKAFKGKGEKCGIWGGMFDHLHWLRPHDGACSKAYVLTPNMALPPAPIVEHVNVIEDICMIQILGFVDPFSDALLFQRTEVRS